MLHETKTLPILLACTLIFQSGCGTILYPERKGQKAGKIDVAVAALDAVGLLFFIIPGVIAFAVDFNNGTIYLPKGAKGLLNRNEVEKVRFDARSDGRTQVEAIVLRKTGVPVRLDQPELQVVALGSEDELFVR